MAEEIYDVTDVKENPNRYCPTCRKMLSISCYPSERHLSPSPHFPYLTKGRRFFHSDIRWQQGQTLSCSLCSFLRKGLKKDSETGIAWPDFKAFADSGPGDPAAAFVDVRPPNLDKSSAIVFEKSASWIAKCLSGHKRCSSAEVAGISLLPTRVIDVGGNDPASIAKIHVSVKGERGAYCCLSYCWGQTKQLMTTHNNLEAMTREIPKSQLARTTLDAIEVTKRLGLRYLWIDALCIIQDSNEDKSAEIKKMGEIFKNSIITIAAATAKGTEEGFLRTPRKEFTYCKVRLRLPNAQIGTILFTLHDYYYSKGSQSAESNPLEKRGWCLQEFLLSPRLLMFFNLDVVWCCQTTSTTYTDDYFSKTGFSLNRLPPGIFARPTIKQITRNIFFSSPETRMNTWELVVVEFASRQLTFSSDRLAAIAGISQELSRIWADQYFYGFWRKVSDKQVAWHALQRSCRISNIPTWTWASVSAPISFDVMHNYEYQIVAFIESTPPEQDADTFQTKPKLALKGVLIEPSALRPRSNADQQVMTMALDVTGEDPKLYADEEIYYFMLGYSTWYETFHNLFTGSRKKSTAVRIWLLILRKAEDGDYTRIGVAKYDFLESILLHCHSRLLKMLKAQPIKVIHLI